MIVGRASETLDAVQHHLQNMLTVEEVQALLPHKRGQAVTQRGVSVMQQLRISVDILLRTPTSAQGNEYSKRCQSHRRLGTVADN